jgi:hypothetical protein
VRGVLAVVLCLLKGSLSGGDGAPRGDRGCREGEL